MKIKSLEITGFKSFYEKTRINFDLRLSAIVGPNGCGKSNVLDAIRWILGEQNPRQLRANVMEEVISNGSEFLKPLGMAEVSLLMENVPSYNFEQVEIKRRVFRSGETEYYLNGVPCRLKDITDIFIDTGSGARAYSVIGQGRVDQMITAKPEDKRTLLEEVAGIRKYKIRRRETETRIKTTRENLSRVRDMAGEVKRQMDTLSLQAKHAEEFRELSEESRRLEAGILRARIERLENKKKTVSEEKTAVEQSIAKSEEEIIQVINLLKKLNNQSLITDDKVRELENSIYRTKTELQTKISSQELIKTEISSIERFIEKIESESALLGGERLNLAAQTGIKRSALEEVGLELEKEKEEIAAKENMLAAIKTGFAEIRAEHQGIRASLFKTLDEYSSLKGAALGYEKELKDLYSKKEVIEKELSEIELERKAAAEEISNLERTLSENEAKRQHISESRDRLLASLSSLSDAQATKREEYDRVQDRLNESSSRLTVLNQIQANYEWLPEGIRNYILEHKGNGVLGTVSDFISVPEGYEKAVEAVLGDKIKWILVEENSQALSAIDSLRQRSLGRGTFVPARGIEAKAASNGRPASSRPLSEIVHLDNKLSVIENILNSVYMVPSLGEGLRMQSEMGGGSSFVTAEGDYLHPDGVISGGTAQPGVLERKREIENLKTLISGLERETDTLGLEIEANELEIKGLHAGIKDYESGLVETGIVDAETRKDILNFKNNLEKLERRIEAISLNLQKTGSETDEKLRLMDETRVKLEGLDSEKSVLEQRFGEVEGKIQKAEEEERSVEREIAEKKVKCASLVEKEKSLIEDLTELERRIRDIDSRIELESRNIEEKKQEKLSFIEKDRYTVEEISLINKAISENEEKLQVMRQERNTVVEETRAANENRESLNTILSDLRLRNNSLELDLNSLQIEAENINDIIERTNLSEIISGMAERGEPAEINIHEEEARLKKLQAQIEKFGPVNLLAPEEYNKLEERHKFLNEQMEDLNQAINSLGKAINKIDKESEKRFRETFELMDQKFQEIFSRLFRGGEGKLVLTEPENMLESGVEVMVRPRGKKFQAITLLSGGEKALSAIALIIAACLIKPAPFLLFDEIDAPLDDRNTSYFIELVKEIDRNSQVILITHNKKTMQQVNSLIGITSNKSGTSTVVSVDLS
ncbi:MAG: chromosome segregation protein SMC [Thermodesulfobacteriota bacterium]